MGLLAETFKTPDAQSGTQKKEPSGIKPGGLLEQTFKANKPSATLPSGVYTVPEKKSQNFNDFAELVARTPSVDAGGAVDKIQKEQTKESLLNKALNILQTGEFVAGGILSGKGALKGIEEKITPSDALGIDNKFLGFAVDVLMDPTTYITFGAGTGAKLATKAGTKILNKTGKKTLESLVSEFGEASGRKFFEDKLIAEGGEAFLEKTGLKFMGKQIIPEATVKFPFKVVNDAIEKTPFAGSIYKNTKDVIAQGFKPFAKIEKELGEKGASYITAFSHLMRGTRAEIDLAVTQVSDLAKDALVKYEQEMGGKISIQELGDRVRRVVEGDVESSTMEDLASKNIEPGIEPSQVVSDLADLMDKGFKEIAESETEKGLLKGSLPNYMRRFMTPEAAGLVQKNPNILSEISKPLKINLGAAKERKLEGTIETINASFKEKNGVNLFEPNAFKAYAGRTAESIKARRMHDWFSSVGTNFGVVGNTVEKEIKDPNGIIRKINVIEDQYIDGLKYTKSSVPELQGLLLPEPIVAHLNETYKFLTDDEATKSFLNVYDRIQRFWKGSVTGWFPAFHGRNFLGGAFNNWLAGVKNPLRYAQGHSISLGKKGSITTSLGKKISYDDLRTEMHELGVMGQTGMIDVMKKMEDNLSSIGETGMSKLVKNPLKTIGEVPVRAMEMVENRLRIPLYLERRIAGDDPSEAAKAVFTFHFDYAPEALTSFERNFMKRVMPFYRWTRGNIPLQLEQMLKQPGKYAAVGKAIENIGQPLTDEDKSVLPSYVKEGLAFKLDSEEGFIRLVSGLGLPIEDINKLWAGNFNRTIEGIVGQFSPVIKYPIEVATGHNLFFGEDIEKLDFAYPFVASVPGLKDWLEIAEYEKSVGTKGFRGNPDKLHLLNTLIGRYYATLGKASDSENEAFARVLNFVTGAKVKTYDIEQEQFWRDQDFQKELIDMLHHKGINVTQKPVISKKTREAVGLPTGKGSTKKTQALIDEMPE